MITKEAVQFLEDLVANNNTEWMHANKKRYENYKKDYHNYIALILAVMKPLDKSLEPLEVKNCTFRINRFQIVIKKCNFFSDAFKFIGFRAPNTSCYK